MQDKGEKVFQENVLNSSVKQHKNKLGIWLIWDYKYNCCCQECKYLELQNKFNLYHGLLYHSSTQ